MWSCMWLKKNTAVPYMCIYSCGIRHDLMYFLCKLSVNVCVLSIPCSENQPREHDNSPGWCHWWRWSYCMYYDLHLVHIVTCEMYVFPSSGDVARIFKSGWAIIICISALDYSECALCQQALDHKHPNKLTGALPRSSHIHRHTFCLFFFGHFCWRNEGIVLVIFFSHSTVIPQHLSCS